MSAEQGNQPTETVLTNEHDYKNLHVYKQLHSIHIRKGEDICCDFTSKKVQLPSDEKNQFGIGFEVKQDEKWLRAGCMMTDDPSDEEIANAVELLLLAIIDPENPKVKVSRGDEPLTGNTMMTTALTQRIEAANKQ